MIKLTSKIGELIIKSTKGIYFEDFFLQTIYRNEIEKYRNVFLMILLLILLINFYIFIVVTCMGIISIEIDEGFIFYRIFTVIILVGIVATLNINESHEYFKELRICSLIFHIFGLIKSIFLITQEEGDYKTLKIYLTESIQVLLAIFYTIGAYYLIFDVKHFDRSRYLRQEDL
ncbi:hypothetical protein HERIO_1686 [Hepatospora eriocheir]|uniref:Uncharacterized protein n=1 Tax=Hepatospora eriocheir TaxID=1081669 RepID=A0A1X0Q9C5_9MICR|nr:hypothetical protein HERIO_1686 [Hepatospora eriocheir]